MADVVLIRLGEKGWCIPAGWIRRDDVLSFFRYRPEILTLNLWLSVRAMVLFTLSVRLSEAWIVCLSIGYFVNIDDFRR